jgi:transcriptional regulator with XRE-family HTH domain
MISYPTKATMKKYVKDIRTRLKLNRPAFARLLCVSTRTVSRWENGLTAVGSVHVRDLVALDDALTADPKLGARYHGQLAAGQMDLFKLLEQGRSDEQTHSS